MFEYYDLLLAFETTNEFFDRFSKKIFITIFKLLKVRIIALVLGIHAHFHVCPDSNLGNDNLFKDK